MEKLTLMDKIIECAMRGEALPIEGKARITLTDVRTGKKDVTEHKNDVTRTLANIINSNFSGASNYYNMLPFKQFFSGVLCFGSTLNGIPTRPQNQNENTLIAHAGDEAHATASTLRGNPNIGEQVITDTSIKQVWDWSTNQGNGTINAVCLCPNVLGNYGLMPLETTPVYMMSGGSMTMTCDSSWTNRQRAMKNPIEVTTVNESISVYINGTTFEEITCKHDYLKFGILRSGTDWTEQSNRTATIRTFTSGRINLAFDDDYYYVYEMTSGTTIKIDKIDRDDMSVTTADLTLTGTSLYSGNLANSGFVQWGFDGTYLYLPDSTCKKFYKVNIGNASDVTLLNGEVSTISTSYGITNYDPRIQPVVVNDGLILGENYLINYDTVYETTFPQSLNGTSRGYGYNDDVVLTHTQPELAGTSTGFPALCMSGFTSSSSARVIGQGLVIPRVCLSTVNNLSEAKTKSSNMMMKIEYTLTEV